MSSQAGPSSPPRLRHRDFVAPSELQEVLSARQILAQYKLESVYEDPLRVDFTQLKRQMEHTSFVGRTLQDSLDEMLDHPVTMDSLPPPPTFPDIPSPVLPPAPDLPPLIPNSEGPQFGPDSDEEAKAAVSDFLERQRARIAERRKIRDDHNALCARIQADHYAAVDAQQGEVFASWDAERVAMQAEVNHYKYLVADKKKTIDGLRETYLKESLTVGRQVKRDHEIRALTCQAIRVRDELSGNMSFGEDIDLPFEAVHLGDIPKGFGYVPIDAATAPVLPSVSTPSSKGKGLDPLERPNAGRIIVKKLGSVSSGDKGKGKGKETGTSSNLESAKRLKVNLVLPHPPPEFASPSSSGSKKRTACEQGSSKRPSKHSRTDDTAPFSYKGRHTCNPYARSIDFPLLKDDIAPPPPAGFNSWKAWFTQHLPVGRHLLRFGPHPMVRFPKPCTLCNEKGWPCVMDGDPEGKSANCASCVRAKVVCSPVCGGNANGLNEFLTYQRAYTSHFSRELGHLRPTFAAPFDFDTWYPPDIDWRSAAERRTKVPFKWTAAATQKGGASDVLSSSKRKAKGAQPLMEIDVEMEEEETKEDEQSSLADETETEPVAPPIAVLPDSSESQVEEPVSCRAKFSYTAADLLGGAVTNELPRSQYNSRHHLPRDDFDMPVPPDSCFGKMRTWNIPQENYPLPITAARYHARQSWNVVWFMEMSRMALYSAGTEFAAALLRNSSPLDEMAPEEQAWPLIIDGIPFPCPVPTLDSDEAWRTTALLKARTYPQSLRFGRALLDADTEGRILPPVGVT
ncbi:hypothetical protein B0H16DRAFT_1858225 [Mycena metata]|uniref:Uncharacterized protein n=1 Tax=Mycena metata TaxID=1033252 RepID=A0AAD7DGK1_9AGAR|nr:hypothetical protein B0H16DRAFT_1858225 [Mycena metata]